MKDHHTLLYPLRNTAIPEISIFAESAALIPMLHRGVQNRVVMGFKVRAFCEWTIKAYIRKLYRGKMYIALITSRAQIGTCLELSLLHRIGTKTTISIACKVKHFLLIFSF